MFFHFTSLFLNSYYGTIPSAESKNTCRNSISEIPSRAPCVRCPTTTTTAVH